MDGAYLSKLIFMLAVDEGYLRLLRMLEEEKRSVAAPLIDPKARSKLHPQSTTLH
jgi:hypothetical protein